MSTFYLLSVSCPSARRATAVVMLNGEGLVTLFMAEDDIGALRRSAQQERQVLAHRNDIRRCRRLRTTEPCCRVDIELGDGDAALIECAPRLTNPS